MNSRVLGRLATLALAGSLALISGGCKKKAAAEAPAKAPQVAVNRPAPGAPAPPPSAKPAPRPAPLSSAPAAPTVHRETIEELLARIQDAYFDYDRHNLRPDAEANLQKDVATLRELLKDFPRTQLVLEGDADERGSAEYNLALGDLRAREAKSFLVKLGIPDNQLAVVSYGKEKPVCTDHSEDCWQKNRRAHLAPKN